MGKIENIIELYDHIQKGKVSIKFEKKDKTERVMNCTLNFDLIPESNQIKKVNMSNILRLIKNSKLIHVYDLDNGGWRSIPFERSEWLITSNNTKYDIEINTNEGGEDDMY